MWTRAELKIKAKEVLKTTFWKSLFVSFIIAIVGGGGGGSTISQQYSQDDLQQYYNYNDYTDMASGTNIDGMIQELLPFIILGIFIFLVVFLFILAFRIFLGYPLEVGGRKFFVKAAKGDSDLNHLGYAFKKNRYLNIVKTMFLRGLFTFLWVLLFIIPGIIAAYSYYMVPYILTDNPEMSSRRALQLSKDMTQGHKLEIFVLELSFLGWYLLCWIPAFIGATHGIYLLDFAAVIGMFLIAPYVNATKAQLYIKLRDIAKDKAMISNNEEII